MARFANVSSSRPPLCGTSLDRSLEEGCLSDTSATQPVEDDDSVGSPRVIRYTDVNGVGVDPTVIVGDLPNTNPATCAHVGGNLHFGTADGIFEDNSGSHNIQVTQLAPILQASLSGIPDPAAAILFFAGSAAMLPQIRRRRSH